MSYNPNNPNGQNTMANSAPVTIASNQTASTSANTTMQNAVSATANGTSLSVAGYGTAVVAITGTFVATVTFEGTTDAGTTWTSLSAIKLGAGTLSLITTTGLYRITTTGIDSIRARVTWTSGTSITAIGRATNSTNSTEVVTLANDAGKTIKSLSSSAAISGNNTLAPASSTPTNKLKIKAFTLTTTSTTAVTCIFQSNAGGTELWRVVLQAPSGVSVGANLTTVAPDYLFSTSAGHLLNLNLSSGQTIHYSVSYFEEA